LRSDLTSPEAFEALVREHQGMVFRTLTRLTGAGAHVEDLAQDTFLRLYKALPYFRGDSTVGTYLYRIVVNVAQDEWKRRRRERTHLVSEPAYFEDEPDGGWMENFAGDELTEHARDPEQRLGDAEVQQAVECALGELAEMERAVLVLYHQEECSYEGIAAALQMPINTVRTHLHRGRKRLSELVRARLDDRPLPQPGTKGIPAGRMHESSANRVELTEAVRR
jgi:RNA polymerase sigma-70 factor (ECF subfamily)